MRRIITLCCLLLLLRAGAQEKPRAARIFIGNTEQVGYVQVPPSKGTPQELLFSETEDGSFRPLGAEVITRAELAGGPVYERFSVEVPVLSKAPGARVASDYTRAFPAHTLLLERLVDGGHQLYQFVDAYGYVHFYFRPRNGTLKSLTYTPYTENGQTAGVTAYQGELAALARDLKCSDWLAGTTAHTPYEALELSQFFSNINACKPEAVLRDPSDYSMQLRVGPAIGFLQSDISLRALDYHRLPGLSEGSIGTVKGPVFGAFLELAPLRRLRHMTFGLNMLVAPMHQTVNLPYTDTSRHLTVTTASISYTNILADISVRYAFGSGSFQPFVEGGAFLRMTLSGSGSYQWYFSDKQVPSEPLFGPHAVDAGMLGGLGLQCYRASLHLRYAKPVTSEPFATMLSVVLKVNLSPRIGTKP
ncbi:hypothetical protein [Flaviaesturariibacter aridisoli]|uniref:Outer membrane protein beta-barrel domain-containing protein n=1 Tax=Flaviaesturariibacter aridisoli TaxID=2545761 RepID=A0A4R4E282_9BACT|nr:hypothetical protein [Flaviaesturariibacter aridisoli]TCZ73614.1 hypothetical protein E0486_04855 [Flaviaesturariibacter aridisoli]